jgi:type I restriction enzyme M protein
MTSSIARMNCFLHGIEDFQIVRGDTLAEPKLVEGDRLMRSDVALANPPYSIKQWDRDAFASDPWGRNPFDTPAQGRAKEGNLSIPLYVSAQASEVRQDRCAS